MGGRNSHSGNSNNDSNDICWMFDGFNCSTCCCASISNSSINNGIITVLCFTHVHNSINISIYTYIYILMRLHIINTFIHFHLFLHIFLIFFSMAVNLSRMKAIRDSFHRTPCIPDGERYLNFENQFDYEPTEDQRKCFKVGWLSRI